MEGIGRASVTRSLRSSYNDKDDVNEMDPERRSRELIVGGRVVPSDKEYPYFVSLNHYCGGALIAPDIVLTAGHCAPPPIKKKRKSHYDVDLRVGTYTLYDYDSDGDDEDEDGDDEDDNGDDVGGGSRVDTGYESFDIVNVIVHPKWERLGDDEFRYDFAILQLNASAISPSIPYRKYIRINRDNAYPIPSTNVTVMGMGMTDPNDPSSVSDILREVNVTVIANDVCSTKNSTSVVSENSDSGDDDEDDGGDDEDDGGDDDEDFVSYRGRIKSTHMCTWGMGRDSCAYDSGSPIIIKGNEPRRQSEVTGWNGIRFGGIHLGGGHRQNQIHESPHVENSILVGLVSWGEQCADPIFPGVNARVSSVSDWIDRTICSISQFDIPSDIDCSFSAGTSSTTENKKDHDFNMANNGEYWVKSVSLIILGFLVGLIARFVYNRSYPRRSLGYEPIK